jgi:hypothetical protein
MLKETTSVAEALGHYLFGIRQLVPACVLISAVITAASYWFDIDEVSPLVAVFILSFVLLVITAMLARIGRHARHTRRLLNDPKVSELWQRLESVELAAKAAELVVLSEFASLHREPVKTPPQQVSDALP